MKYMGPMIVVKDINQTKAFYTKVLGLRVISDFGENITFTGGLSAQTENSWIQFTNGNKKDFKYGGNNFELYFEEDDFDNFIHKIKELKIDRIGELTEMPWGQKIVRFYDPDKHIIEVGENLKIVVKRLFESGMKIDEIAKKTFLTEKYIQRLLNNVNNSSLLNK